ncbi:Hypothetical_protein [Hexamita inflata]|uniref:Hypothetical_protein n=1 Tax=Hexamita inflata TaxID=28002 RepID=A0AA86NTJ1_9EUKA|nr:Hypothetical protein HINF_LOCUS13084 [Hexamita inflata]
MHGMNQKSPIFAKELQITIYKGFSFQIQKIVVLQIINKNTKYLSDDDRWQYHGDIMTCQMITSEGNNVSSSPEYSCLRKLFRVTILDGYDIEVSLCQIKYDLWIVMIYEMKME